jgi:hypothetical protein
MSGQTRSRCSAGRSLLRLPTTCWCGSQLDCVRRTPWRGVAQEGTAQLEEAIPTSPFPTGFEERRSVMEQVIIGVDPHKLSATIEVVDKQEHLLGSGRFTTDKTGYAAMRSYVKAWPNRVWAVEGANGAGRPLSQRLVEAGQQVVDVPAKKAARVRLFDTGHNRKTRWMLTRSRSSRYAPKGCGCSQRTANSRRCGC